MVVVHIGVEGDYDDDDGGGGDDYDDHSDDTDDCGDEDGYLHADHSRLRVVRMPGMLRWKAFMLAGAAHKQRCKACHRFVRCRSLICFWAIDKAR